MCMRKAFLAAAGLGVLTLVAAPAYSAPSHSLSRTNAAASAAPSLEPFLFFSDLYGSYQGGGWIKRDFLLAAIKLRGSSRER
jgi:hypothetical protein